MQYRTDPKTGNRLSVLGYGCMRLSRRGGGIDQDKADRELMQALGSGVNYFDTAYIYPGSEVCLGRFMRRYSCRDRLYLATKLPQYRVQKPADADRFFNEELERLGTDHIDYYLLHMLNDAESWQRLCGLGLREWIAEKKRSGAIRSIGFSFHGGTAQFRALVDAFDWDFCQIQYNYVDVHSQAGVEGLRYAHGKGLPVVIMEPLRGGKLAGGLPRKAREAFARADAGRSPAEWGLRWLWDQEEVTVVLSGMNDAAQITENCRIAEESLPGCLGEAERACYEEARAALREATHVGCTGCGYCQPCPKGVDIPTCFAIYNGSYVDGFVNGMREYMMCTTLRKVRSNAGLCVKCGKCETHCPQHLPIRDALDQVKKRLENPVYHVIAKTLPLVMKY